MHMLALFFKFCVSLFHRTPHELEVDSIYFLDFIAVNDGDEIYLKYYTVPTFEN